MVVDTVGPQRLLSVCRVVGKTPRFPGSRLLVKNKTTIAEQMMNTRRTHKQSLPSSENALNNRDQVH